MREEARIDRITNKLNQLWHKYPDLRFHQLIENIFGRGDKWYVEDTDTEIILNNILLEENGNGTKKDS